MMVKGTGRINPRYRYSLLLKTLHQNGIENTAANRNIVHRLESIIILAYFFHPQNVRLSILWSLFA